MKDSSRDGLGAPKTVDPAAAEVTCGAERLGVLAKWGEELRQVGATPLEVTRFQDLIRAQPAADREIQRLRQYR
jgi:hypothetical protein